MQKETKPLDSLKEYVSTGREIKTSYFVWNHKGSIGISDIFLL